MAKLITNNYESLELDTFAEDPDKFAYMIRELSGGLSKQEVCEYFGINYEELTGEDLQFFNTMHTRGRTEYKNAAVQRLFDSMKKNGGHQPALAYLVRFSESWEQNAAEIEGRTFKFVLEDSK